MKTGIKVILFSIISSIILVAFGYGTAFANTKQEDDAFCTDPIAHPPVYDWIYWQQYLGTGLSDSFSSIGLSGHFLGGHPPHENSGFSVTICEGDTGESDFNMINQNSAPCSLNSIILGTTEIMTEDVTGRFTLTFPETITLNPTKYYLINALVGYGSYFDPPREYHDSAHGVEYICGSANDDSYLNGTFGNYGYIPNYPQLFRNHTEPVYDLYFVLGEEAPETSLAIEYPVSGSTIGDFSYWTFLAQGLPEIFDEEQFYIYDIEYSGGFTMPIAEYHDTGRTAGGGEFFIDKENLLTDGSWGALIKIYDYSYNLIVESPAIAFTINTGIETPYPITTCEGGGWVGDSFCKVLQFLFIPSVGSLNRFKTLLEPIESKAPIGYFLLIKGVFSDMGEGSSPFNLPSDNAFDTNIFEPIKTGLTFIFWLILAFWIFKRISNLDI